MTSQRLPRWMIAVFFLFAVAMAPMTPELILDRTATAFLFVGLAAVAWCSRARANPLWWRFGVPVFGIALAFLARPESGARTLSALISDATWLLHHATTTAFAPWSAPHLGAMHDAPLMLGYTAGIAGLGSLAISLCNPRSTQVFVIASLLGIGTLASVVGSMTGIPSLSLSLPLILGVWSVVGSFALLLWREGGRAPRPRAVLLRALALMLMVLPAAGAQRSYSMATEWTSGATAWRAILAEGHRDSLRLYVSRRLLECGDPTAYIAELRRGRLHGVPNPVEELRFARWLADAGRPADAFPDVCAVAPEAGTVEDSLIVALAEGAKTTADFEWLCRVSTLSPTLQEANRRRIAQRLLDAGHSTLARQVLEPALATPRIDIATIKLRAKIAEAQGPDFECLEALGRRATLEHPEDALGYVVLGKLAKIWRRDEEMVQWHEAALERDPNRADLHFELGLVFHGKKNKAARAARHYEQFIALAPTDRRADQVRAWISTLKETAHSSGVAR